MDRARLSITKTKKGSLGGDPIKENLVTGTNTQNVGLSKDHQNSHVIALIAMELTLAIAIIVTNSKR